MKTSFLTLSLLAMTPALHSETAPAAPFAITSPKEDETKLSPAGAPTEVPTVSPSPQTTALTEARRVSAETAAKIGANAPKFSAAKAPDPAAKQLPDLRDIDKPRNRIPRLPREMIEKPVASRTPLEGSADVLQLPAYIVRDKKVPDFKERELLTPAGKLALAYKRRPGLRFGSLFFFSNDGIARALLEDDFERERIAEMRELGGLYRYTEANTGKTDAPKVDGSLQSSGGASPPPRPAR